MSVEVNLIPEAGSLASCLIPSNPIRPRRRWHWNSESADFLEGYWMGDYLMGTEAVARAAWTTGFLLV
jgi:hypothetical protein